VRAYRSRIRTVDRQQTLIIDDPSTIQLIRSGTASVFSSQAENGFAVGHRRFLFRARAGDAVFALRNSSEDDSTTRLLLIATDELSLSEIPIARIQDELAAEGVALHEAIEGWINNIAAFVSHGPLPAPAVQVRVGNTIELDAGSCAHSGRNEFVWFRLETGRAQSLDRTELDVEPGGVCVPIASDWWFRAVEPSRITTFSTEQVIAEGRLIPALSKFHALLLRRLASLEAQDKQDEIRRLEERAVLQQRLTGAALQKAAAVLDPQVDFPMLENSLLTAMSVVGAELGVQIRPPLRSENLDRLNDPVEGIARASRVRHRKVLLRGLWWKTDCGPLLGYWSEKHSPVALLNRRGAGYEIFDPETRKTIPVNDQTVPLLAPEAVMLYPSLPGDVKTPWQLVRFSLQPRFGDVAFIIGLSMLITLIGMLTPMAFAMVIDYAIPDSNPGLLMQLGLLFVAASLGTGVLGLSQGLVTIRTAVAVDATAEAALWDKLLKLKAGFFKQYSTGDLLSRVMAMNEINRTLNGAALQSILSSVTAVLNFGLLLYFSSRLASIAVGLAAAIGIVTIVGGYTVRRYNLVATELGGTTFGLIVQMTHAVAKIRVAGAESRAFATWLKKYSEQLTLVRKSRTVEDWVIVFNQAVPTFSQILLFWIGVDLLTGARSANEQILGIGVFLAFNTALSMFIGGATSLSNTVVDVMDVVVKSKRVEPILQAENEVSVTASDPGSLEGSITLSHVDFRYVAEGPKILHDINIHINPGEFVAIAGPSGSGKSTIVRLLLGFETPQSGNVLFDGQDLAGLDLNAVRRQLGVVLQSGFISSGSIFENIAGGALISMDEAWEAAEDAGLAEDIKQMPMGMQTIVSEGATNLSGGQRQRLLIARALVTRPKVLLLDEATSALDNRTQATISESLRRRRVTRLVIAHRLSTIKNADQIYVIDQGRIVDHGTFAELAGRKGVFSAMIARQTA
jgi:NHLM bacteriocin system ABC transporter ATP-binding protein